jgi:hypothetical protein
MRFFGSLQLSVAILLFHFAPGGSYTTVVVLVQMDKDLSQDEHLTQTACLMAKIEPKLWVCGDF